MNVNLEALVHFQLITQEQADEYSRQVNEVGEAYRGFVATWLAEREARTPWWKRWWVRHVAIPPYREMNEAWTEFFNDAWAIGVQQRSWAKGEKPHAVDT